MNYIYLFQPKEYFDKNLQFYKITRFKNFTKNSLIILQILTLDSEMIEKYIIQSFNLKYTRRYDLGINVFEGDPRSMMVEINRIVCELLYNVDFDKMID